MVEQDAVSVGGFSVVQFVIWSYLLLVDKAGSSGRLLNEFFVIVACFRLFSWLMIGFAGALDPRQGLTPNSISRLVDLTGC